MSFTFAYFGPLTKEITYLLSNLDKQHNWKEAEKGLYNSGLWKLKLLRIIPELRENWTKIRAQAHQTALLSTVIQIMNRDLELKDFSKVEIFLIKQSSAVSRIEELSVELTEVQSKDSEVNN